MPGDGIRAEILKNNIADAQEHPSCRNWTGGVVKQLLQLLQPSRHGLAIFVFKYRFCL